MDDQGRPLHVAYVTMQFPVPSETFASNEVRRLQALGVRVQVYALKPARHGWRELLRERGLAGLPVSHSNWSSTLQGLLVALRRPLLLCKAFGWVARRCRVRLKDLVATLALLPRAFQILERLERKPVDVVHLYWGHYPAVVGWLVAQRLSTTVLSMALGAYDLTTEYPGSVDAARKAKVLRTNAAANIAHVARFTGVPGQRVEVIFDGVDTELIASTVRQNAKVAGRIATAGRLVPAKGVAKVLRAFAAVHNEFPHTSLTIMGHGPERAELERLASELGVSAATHFMGHVSHQRALKEFAKAEVFLLLTSEVSERLPNVVKEAMACRCVCLTTRTPGIEELLQDRRTGFLVSGDDHSHAAHVVGMIFRGEVDVTEMTARAVIHVTEHFDLRKSVERYLELWQREVERAKHERTLDQRALERRPTTHQQHAPKSSP